MVPYSTLWYIIAADFKGARAAAGERGPTSLGFFWGDEALGFEVFRGPRQAWILSLKPWGRLWVFWGRLWVSGVFWGLGLGRLGGRGSCITGTGYGMVGYAILQYYSYVA